MKKILIVHTAFIGDVVLSTPLIEAVKDRFPDSDIDFLAIPAGAEVLENNPFLRKVIRYAKKGSDRGVRKMFRLARQLQQEKYDIVFVPHCSLRSAFIVYFAGIKKRIGFDRSLGAFLFTEKVVYQKNAHEVERNLALLRLSDEQVKKYQPHIFPEKNDITIVEDYIKRIHSWNNGKFVAIAPGSVWPTKKWIESGFVDIIQKLIDKESSLHVFLIGGRQDFELNERIAGHFEDRVHNTAGQFSLCQSAHLISRCRALLSNDSGPLHLGVAVGTRVIAIFGPTVPAFGFSPHGEGHVVIENDGLYCRPCSIHGPKKCPEKHFRCMKEISQNAVFQAVYSAVNFGEEKEIAAEARRAPSKK